MDSLKDKLLKLKESLSKGMKNGGIGGPGSVKAGASLPSLPKVGSTNNNSSTPSTGISQASKKNPVKSAEQTMNSDIKDRKIKEAQAAMKTPQLQKQGDYLEIFKTDANGQWSLEKMKHRETAVPGVSEMGIEARRGTGKPSSETGYARVTSPDKHKETARQIARENLAETKSIKPKLPKDVKKSGYKGYTESDNARRKANNLGEETGIHTMNRIKSYGGSGPNAAARQAAKDKAKSKKNPVKVFTPEEIAAENKKRGLS